MNYDKITSKIFYRENFLRFFEIYRKNEKFHKIKAK
jgi:hypothetical protein